MSNYSRHVLYLVIKEALDEAIGDKNPTYRDVLKAKSLENN
jgi:hypothetical protein